MPSSVSPPSHLTIPSQFVHDDNICCAEQHNNRSSRTTRSSPPRGRSRSPSRSRSRGRGTDSSPIRSSTRHRGGSDDARDTELNDLRRQLHVLMNAQKPAEEGKKRKRSQKGTEPTALQKGRAIPRRVVVFDDLVTIQLQRDTYRAKGYHEDQGGEEVDELEDLSEEERTEKRELERGYTAVREMEHVVKDFITEVGKEGGNTLINELERGAESAKTHDTQSATRIVGKELNRRIRKINEQKMKEFREARPLTAERNEPSLELLDEFDEGSRANRGLQNDMTGGLLCPAEIDWNDADTREAVQRMDPEYDFASSARSRCFYKDEEFNADSPDEGYLQSYLLLQVYRTIYTSPSSAKDQSEDVENLPPAKKSKPANSHRAHVANIIHLSEVTPRSIAYAAVHLHLALTDASQWTNCYDGYNYRDLWNFVVDFFEDPADDDAAKQAKDLLKWWTDRIFTGTGSAANNRGTKMISRRQAVAKNV
ncbi:hypothetical protein F5878DRAFT_727993 [Lentinula raphanica]|uniref:Uncharacterized protein n=1 Tax=Lentinula raphanica TaxID=153919 RepID=A0AA38UE76_9AGAR|nr:hypothetical protein F5878DRAFT_727993 [Lentinula raphanica]